MEAAVLPGNTHFKSLHPRLFLQLDPCMIQVTSLCSPANFVGAPLREDRTLQRVIPGFAVWELAKELFAFSYDEP